MPRNTEQPTVSRRRALRMLAGVGVGVPLLVACGRDEPDEGSSPNPDSSADLPSGLSGSVKLALPTATSADEDFYTEKLAQFSEDTGVDAQPLFFPNPDYGQALQGLFQGGDEPDVFRMVQAQGMMRPAWKKGWIQPLDGYAAITDLLEGQYGETALDPLVSGLHIEDELFGVPGVRNDLWGGLRPLMWNPAIFDQFGVAGPPETWSEFRDAAAKITTDSGGDVFGLALDTKMGTGIFWPLLQTAGTVRPYGGVMVDLLTGEAAAADPSVVDAVDLLRGVVEDGSVISGWQALTPQELWQAWAGDKVAMASISPWFAEEILKLNPDVGMDFAPTPVPDTGRVAYQTTNVGTEWAPTWGMSKASGNADAAAALIAFLGSLDVQREYYGVTNVPSALAHEYADELSETATKILGLEEEMVRRGPDTNVRSADGQQLQADLNKEMPTPRLVDRAFTAVDKGGDHAAEFAAYDAEVQKVLDDGIAKAISDGLNVTEDYLAFPDWDPTSDYTTERL